MMIKRQAITLLTGATVLITLFLFSLLGAPMSSLAQIDPTSQAQTVEAVVNERFTQTAVVQQNAFATQTVDAAFNQALTATAEASSQAATATAAFEATIDAAIRETVVAQATIAIQIAMEEVADNVNLARAFTGGNEDWEPIAYIFPDDPVGAEMMLVPAGEFMMGSSDEQIDEALALCNDTRGNCNRDWFTDESPDHLQQFEEPFWIDRTEVTRAHYQQCVDAGACTETPASDYSTTPDQPINEVTWFQSQDYCEWRGGRLPTEAEWEYAARGPESREYPWGDVWNENNAVYGENSGRVTASVGSRPQGASWVGALDMSGNVSEWVSSLYEAYPYDAEDGREADTGDRTDVRRGVRAGSFGSSIIGFLRGAFRDGGFPDHSSGGLGLRCARSSEATIDAMVQATIVAQATIGGAAGQVDGVDLVNLARAFTGGNEDWEPIAYIFPDDPVGADMMLVPAGEFMMGSEDGRENEMPVHLQQFAEPFWIDRTEVTRAHYQLCADAGVCREEPANRWSTAPEQPINIVSWFDARDYCEWRGGRLPTEAEWEYAARGPDGWTYPWGDVWNEDNAVHDENSGRVTASVGSRPQGASWVGALDMSGNVWEWVSSLYLAYPYDEEDGREADKGDRTDVLRGARGGSFLNSIYFLRGASRVNLDPDDSPNDLGLRCARSSF